jgi:hypothetical protein
MPNVEKKKQTIQAALKKKEKGICPSYENGCQRCVLLTLIYFQQSRKVGEFVQKELCRTPLPPDRIPVVSSICFCSVTGLGYFILH